MASDFDWLALLLLRAESTRSKRKPFGQVDLTNWRTLFATPFHLVLRLYTLRTSSLSSFKGFFSISPFPICFPVYSVLVLSNPLFVQLVFADIHGLRNVRVVIHITSNSPSLRIAMIVIWTRSQQHGLQVSSPRSSPLSEREFLL